MALLSHATGAAAGAIGVTTSAIDTTGATLIVVGMQNIAADDTGFLSDSAGNTWTYTTSLACGSSRFVQFAYCINPTTSATHTFSIGALAFFPVIVVGAFNSTPGSSFDAVTTGNAAASPTTTVAAGSITPANANNLLVTFMGGDPIGSASADSGFSSVDQILKAGGHQGGAMAYLIQSAATAQNPTWTVGSQDAVIGAQQIAFKANSSGTANTLNAAAGAYAVTGSAATSVLAWTMNASAGSYAVSGVAATLVSTAGNAFTLSVDPGVYAVTGVSFAQVIAYNENAVAGAYAVTGLDASLGQFAIFSLNAAAGSYAITGTSAGPVAWSRTLSPGAYTINPGVAYLRGPNDPPFASTGGIGTTMRTTGVGN